MDDAAAADDGLADAIGALRWAGESSADDLAWVSAWLHAPKRKGAWIAADEAPPELANRVRGAFEQ